jgi:hypothetical protein
MNESGSEVRDVAREVVVELLAARGIQPKEMDANFGEESVGAAIELRLTRFADAILAQAKPRPAN